MLVSLVYKGKYYYVIIYLFLFISHITVIYLLRVYIGRIMACLGQESKYNVMAVVITHLHMEII